MKNLKILGSGCAKCRKLAELTAQAAKELGIEHELAKVEDITEILNYGVMMTPALVVDGVVKVVGRLPKIEEIKQMIA